MKTLANPEDEQEIVERLLQIGPATEGKWGKMMAAEMICHLSDSFRVIIGEREAEPNSNWFKRSVYKWVALRLPVRWPHGIKAVPECDPELDGTHPADFESDVNELLRLLERFTTEPWDFDWQAHPIFGEMSDEEWLRWGYLHMDHHLRQFGA
jgi:hypothetical protein